PPGSNQDTVMIVQRKVDSLFSDPLPLFENFGSYVYTPPAILSNDSSVFMAYSSFQGVRYYELHQLGGLPADSLILTGHSSPDFTIDSLGGKYLVSVYENRVYLSTKDVVLSVTENHEIPPEAFRLGQNFPNPFNPQTRIPFDIYHHGNVEIVIYDLLGREVARLMKEDKTPGSYVAEWNARGIASGTYFYSLKVQGTALTRKMNVMK
ncbi:MAG TPA: T9SS type A sorting domain-containing protein, partial [Bacteroidota bacterium]|nr:T9SS type A sorting domain-containing protein [Bacteroidota bacterium]